MCGIAGIVKTQNSKLEIRKEDIKKMTDAIAHRGPDDEGYLVASDIALGHRRLSILDLSPAGHQPMFYDNNNLAIVFNGEVYNYLEIREELLKKGYKFRSESDTEVIMAAYQEWGVKCLEHFNGMWAFILYDKKNNLVFIARDRLGVKPVYYCQDRDKILIASEIKAILKYPGIAARPNEKNIWQYLVSGWLDHSEETFFEGVKELRGGHYLIIQNTKTKIKKYWDLKDTVNKAGDGANISQFQTLFLDAVRLRLRSDVPIGTCLSGGLDSSAIVCAINRFLKQEKFSQIGNWQKTFSAVYGAQFPEADEEKYIKEVIKKTGAKSFKVKPKARDLALEIKKLIYHQDQPFATTSIFAQWNVFRLAASKKMKVMLDGQGADELLAGYTGYFGLYFQHLLKQKKYGQLTREFYSFAKLHPPFVKNLKTILGRALIAGYLGERMRKNQEKINPAFSVFRPKFLEKFTAPKRENFSQDSFQSALYNSLMMNLSPLLRYEDRNSMAFGIESRVPFLDYRLVEFIFSLPANYKIRNGETKWIMRQALKGLLPEKIRKRQDKIGFATPEENWLRSDLKEELEKCFSSKSFASRKFFQVKEVKSLYNKFLAGKFRDSQIFWRMYCLEMWMRVFID